MAKLSRWKRNKLKRQIRELMPEDQPKNPVVRAAWNALLRKGYAVTKQGWPDVVGFNEKTGTVALVTVRRHRSRRIKQLQHLLIKSLIRGGTISYEFDGEDLNRTNETETNAEIKKRLLQEAERRKRS